jgi:lysophospholipase
MTHGYGEHIELYYESIRFYQERGFDVWMMEWQGHGRSDRDDPVCKGACDGKKPGPRGMLTHMKDLETFVNKVVEKQPGKPVIMSTNSMGGHIGLLAMKYNPDMFDGAVLSTPMFDIARLGLPVMFRPAFRTLFNAVAATPFGNRQLPGDYALLNKLTEFGNNAHEDNRFAADDFRREYNEQARRKYADIQIDRPTWAWVASAYDTIIPSLKEDFLRDIKTPMLIGSAGRDNLVDNAAHRRVTKLAPHAERILLPTAEHSLWFENEGNFESWTHRIDQFLAKVAPAQNAVPRPDTGPAPEGPAVAARQQPPLRMAA